MRKTANLPFVLALLSLLPAAGCAANSPDGPQEDEEQPGEIDPGTVAGEPLPGASAEPLPPPVSESEEKSGAPTLAGGTKKLTTKSFSSGIVAVYENGVWIASFTKGARTVRVAGKARTLRDPTDSAGDGVSHDEYVRLLAKPFSSFGTGEETWLADRRTDSSDDILALGARYFDGTKLDSKYVFGNDYDDYLDAKSASARGIDCSGFVRLIYGKQTLPALLSGGLLPRTSKDQLAKATGILTIANDGKKPAVSELERLRVGDLVFFDVSSRNDAVGGIDHVGFYAGKDNDGHMRFINSTPNNGKMTGPTMMAKFVLDGTSFWATHFRGARRL
jgi:cell wall-associated NlpC family hydrolase